MAVRWLARGVVAVLWAGAPPAFAAVTVPGCDGLLAWSSTVDLNDKSFAVTPALKLPGALADDKLTAAFGAPLLAWEAADTKAAAQALSVCSKEAKKARDAGAVAAYGAGYNAVAKQIPYVLKVVEKARANAATYMAAIDELPDSPDLDRGLRAVLEGQPGAPDRAAFQGLPREISDPTYRLAAETGMLPAADRTPMTATLADRRQRIQASIGGEARQQVAAASADAAGIFALMELQRQGAGVDPATDAAIVDRAEEIRAGLRAATPAQWVPPACADLYAWAGQTETNATVNVGRYRMMAVFADDALVPVFNLPIAAWSDAEVQNMSTLRALCTKAWQAQPDASQVSRPTEQTSELVKLAGKGRWIDNGDSQVQSARQVAVNYAAAQAGMAAALQEIEALPATTESLQPLQALQQRGRDFQALEDDAQRAYNEAVLRKRNRIYTQQYDDAVAALQQVAVDKLDDLPKLVNAAQQAGGGIMDGNARQRFLNEYNVAVGNAVLKLKPDFQEEIDKLPVSRDGLRQAGTAVATYTRVTGTERSPAFGVLHAAAQQRALAIAKELGERNCADALDAADVDDDDAEQPVWGAGKPTTLGALVCGMTAGGNPVSEYEGAGMLSSTHTLKVTLEQGGLHTISLKEAEVAAGQEMLVGFELADANQTKTISVQDWEVLVGMATGERFITRNLCQPVLTTPEDGLSIADRFLAAQCALAEVGGRLY